MNKPLFYKSTLTGNLFPFDEYRNHGYGGIKRGFKDLPANEYPFIFEYGIFPCNHRYIAMDQYWSKCELCGDIRSIINEFKL